MWEEAKQPLRPAWRIIRIQRKVPDQRGNKSVVSLADPEPGIQAEAWERMQDTGIQASWTYRDPWRSVKHVERSKPKRLKNKGTDVGRRGWSSRVRF